MTSKWVTFVDQMMPHFDHNCGLNWSQMWSKWTHFHDICGHKSHQNGVNWWCGHKSHYLVWYHHKYWCLRLIITPNARFHEISSSIILGCACFSLYFKLKYQLILDFKLKEAANLKLKLIIEAEINVCISLRLGFMASFGSQMRPEMKLYFDHIWARNSCKMKWNITSI